VNAPDKTERSLAVKASWISFGLVIGCVCAFLCFSVIDETFRFAHTRHGVLTGFLSRTALWLMWAVTGLAVITGLGSLVLIRRPDITSKAIIGIVARSLIGILAGLFGCVVMWLIVGHRVVGF
jgi:hypothetical protein